MFIVLTNVVLCSCCISVSNTLIFICAEQALDMKPRYVRGRKFRYLCTNAASESKLSNETLKYRCLRNLPKCRHPWPLPCCPRPGWRAGLLQRGEGGRHGDVCQRRRAGPHPVGPGHVPRHRPVPQARPAHSGPEAQLQGRHLSPDGRPHLSVL